MTTYTPEQLTEILRLHAMWCRGEQGGARANLGGADLAYAYLAGANLGGANLGGANLGGARNIPSDVPKTDPPEPYVRATSADHYASRATRYRQNHPEIPVVEALDAKILGVIERREGRLDMGTWHSCSTTHCRAGWAIHLAGEAGYALERKYGPFHAGRMIYLASTGRAPHFFATGERAMEDLRERAAEQVGA